MGLQQSFARGVQAGRCTLAFGQGLPLQPKAHAGAGGPALQFAVDGQHLLAGGAQQGLDLAGNLSLQVVFKHLAFARRQQVLARQQFALQQRRQRFGSLGTPLPLHVHDKAEVGGGGGGVFAQGRQGALQFLQVFGDLLLGPLPALFAVVQRGQCVLDAARQAQGGVDAPGQCGVGNVLRRRAAGQARRQQAAGRKKTQAFSGGAACLHCLVKLLLGGAAALLRDGARFGGQAKRFALTLFAAFQAANQCAGAGQVLLQAFDLRPQRRFKGGDMGARLFGQRRALGAVRAALAEVRLRVGRTLLLARAFRRCRAQLQHGGG